MDLFHVLFTAMLAVNLVFFAFCAVLNGLVILELKNKQKLTQKESAILRDSKSKRLELNLWALKIFSFYTPLYTIYHFGGGWFVILFVLGFLYSLGLYKRSREIV